MAERVTGPDGRLVADLDPEATTLAVARDGRTVLEPSPLGVRAHRAYCTADWDLLDRTDREVAETFHTARGKRREHDHEASEATFTFAEGGDEAALDVRVARDGVAFRYRAPLDETTMVFDEATAFHLPRSALAWVHPFKPNHESTGRNLPVPEVVGEHSAPVLADVGEDWLLLTEAGADGDYAAARFASEDGSPVFDLELPDTSVWGRDELVTPWRVAVVGDLADVVETDLVPALVDGRSVDPGADWVRPGRVAWSWWSESESPSDPERQREFVEYAAEQGWEHVLVDEGWSAEWAPGLVEYAADRGVGVFLWVHWTELHDGEERERRLSRWADWGVAGVKVDFMDHDDQGRLQFYDRLAEAAADHGLLVNFHGSVVPTGLSRRHPHVLTYEGVKGAEYYKFRGVTPAHNCTLPYTRNAVGPMDYTPVAFENDGAHTSPGHELGLSVVFESGLQHFADAPEIYAARPAAESFLARVPATWDETRLVAGAPGVEATLARRRDEEWFLGSITAGPARTVEAPLDFLDAERECVLVRDAEGEAELARETRSAGPADALRVAVPENGGFAARLE